MYQRPGRLLREVWVVIGRAVPLETLPNAVDRGRHGMRGSVDTAVGKDRFWAMFKDRAVWYQSCPPGAAEPWPLRPTR